MGEKASNNHYSPRKGREIADTLKVSWNNLLTAKVTVKMLAELLAPEDQEDGNLKNLSNNECKGGPCSLLLRGRDISTSQESSTTIFYEARKSL